MNNEIKTMADISRIYAKKTPNKLAFYFEEDGRSWTYKELDHESNKAACAMAAAGIGNQELVAYLDKNTPEYFIAFFAGTKLNAVSVAVNWRLAPPEIAYILNNSEARLLLIGEDFLPVLKEMSLDHIKQVIVIGNSGNSGYPSWSDWLEGVAPEDPNIPVNADDSCYELYTSGTTGLPKGVELTHANLIAAFKGSLDILGFTNNSVSLACMPVFHISGSGWGLLGSYWGASTVLTREVDMSAILRLIPEQKITHTIFVPAVLQFLVNVPDVEQVDFSSLEMILYGASPITESVLVRAMEVFGCRFFQTYGLTETSGGICLLLPEDHAPGTDRAYLLRSCGKVLPPMEVRIADPDTLIEVGEGEVGEILLKGPQVMKGYWKDPEANSKAFVDGWFRSGDAGYLKDGYIYIHDRVKDMIISGGENIYPAEIENALMKHEGITDAAVIGIPDEKWGESVLAMITRKDPELTKDEIISYSRTQLAGYKCPKSVIWIEQIPRNPSGKILKTELRKPYWVGQERLVH